LPAAALLAALARGRSLDDFLAGVAGPFVAVVADPRRGALTLARDHLGALGAYVHLDARWLLAASEPAALLRHPAVSDELDEPAAARFLGFRFGHTGRSFFRHVRELPPAHRLAVDGEGERRERYWRLAPPRPAAVPSLEEAASTFLALLGRSLALETEGLAPSRFALSLSGGLDSSALAALLPSGVGAFSWTFAETPECDERPQVEAVAAHLGLRVRWVAGDGAEPLGAGFAARFAHPSSPYVNPFAALKARLYEAARAEGCTHVMVGDGGDAVYGAREYWLRDLLAGRRPGALASLAATVGGARRGDPLARLALRRLLPLRALRRWVPARSPWLTADGRALLPRDAPSPIVPAGRRRHRAGLVAGTRNAELESEEQRLFARCGVERSNPYWFWPLLEAALALPADLLHRDARTKLLTRTALARRLPEPVLASGRVGTLGAFFLRGLARHRDEVRETVFRHPRSDWQRFVDRGFVEPYLAAEAPVRFGHTILWRVISYELWQRRLIEGPL
jgi:asparagine synthase (glutamine-hydrolysing)